MSREDGEARLEAEALRSHKKPWTMESFMKAHEDDFPNGVPPEMSKSGDNQEFIDALDEYTFSVQSVVDAQNRLTSLRLRMEEARARLIELEAQER